VNVTPRISIFCTRFNLSNVSRYVKLVFVSFVHKDYFLTLTKIQREVITGSPI